MRTVHQIVARRLGVADVDIDVVHQVGPVTTTGKPRTVLIRFLKMSDRNKVWAARKNMNTNAEHNSTRLWLKEDLPQKAKQMMDVLYRSADKARKLGKYPSVSVRDFKLFLNGVAYAVDNLESPPMELRPSTIAAPRSNDTWVFFSKWTPLSNYFKRDFKKDGRRFTSVEQFITRERARFAGEEPSVIDKIMKENDPAVLRSILIHMRNDGKQAEWEKVAADKVKPAILAKFAQNEDLRQVLLGMEDRLLGEASPRDFFWGIGLPLGAKGVLERANWKGKNVLGNLLMEVRKMLRRYSQGTD